MPAQFDQGGQLAPLIERAADRLGGRFIDGKHQPPRICIGTHTLPDPPHAELVTRLPPITS